MTTPPFSPLQTRVLAALDLLNTLHCEARDAGSPQLAEDAGQAGRLLDRFIAYEEAGPREGEPLPWSRPAP